jgi:hypothetical protein
MYPVPSSVRDAPMGRSTESSPVTTAAARLASIEAMAAAPPALPVDKLHEPLPRSPSH